jgi:putative nucleotidyltransferase with HDIG domain
MKPVDKTDFFNNIRRSVKISHFVSSIIPLALLVYFSIRYVYPYVTEGDITKVPLDVGILLILAVAISILGLILSTKATNSSISSAQGLNSKLNSLSDITKQFRETMFPDILLKKIMESAMSLTDSESGTLLLYNENDDLQIKVAAGLTTDKITNKIIKPGQGIAGKVAKNGQPVIINNAEEDPLYDREFDHEAGMETRSILCVPLIHFNQIIGAIEMRNKRNGDFSSHDEALLNSLADQASISISQNRSREQQHGDFIHITEILVSAQDYVQNKKGHARRVANYANLIGKQMNFSDIELKKLYHACLLHDIGLLKIDTRDLSKKEKNRQHPRLGYEMIRSISIWSDAAEIILHHHERYDGQGYPFAEKGENIPIGARILFVADTFDVLTSEDSYRKKMDYSSALQEIKAHSGTQFDPQAVEALQVSLIESGMIQ